MTKFWIANIFIIIVATAASNVLEPNINEPTARTDLNDYVDSKIPSIIKYIVENELDPMQLPDIKEGFSVQPVIITYHGELELTNGWLRNLRSLRRSGNVTSNEEGNILEFAGNFAVDNISFDYDYLAKIMNIGPKGRVEGTVKTINVFCEVHMNKDKNVLRLKDFHLYDVGSISIKFTGNALIDWLTNHLVGVVTTLFKDVIFYFVEKVMRNAVEEFIDDYNFANGSGSLRRIRVVRGQGLEIKTPNFLKLLNVI